MPCITLSSGLRLNLAEEAFKDREYIQSLYDNDDKKLESAENDLKAQIQELGENHPDVGDSYYQLGVAYNYRSINDRAIECLEKALEIAVYLFEHGLDPVLIAGVCVDDVPVPVALLHKGSLDVKG